MTFIIEQNINSYIEQLKCKPMQELRGSSVNQSYYEKRRKLQSEFRIKLEKILQCGREICYLWKDENSDLASSLLKNMEIILFFIDICIKDISSTFQIDEKIKIIQNFYQNGIIKDHLLLIQSQCSHLFESVNGVQDILLRKVEEIKDDQRKKKLTMIITNKATVDPMDSKDIIDLQYILNQLYPSISSIPENFIDMIDRYLALGNLIISINQIYKFDFISENAKIEKEERLTIIDKERRRVTSLKSNASSQAELENKIKDLENTNKELENKNKELESKNKDLENKIQKLESEIQENESNYQELHFSLIPILNQTKDAK